TSTLANHKSARPSWLSRPTPSRKIAASARTPAWTITSPSRSSPMTSGAGWSVGAPATPPPPLGFHPCPSTRPTAAALAVDRGGRERGHVGDVAVLGAERADLYRVRQAHEHRADEGGAAQLLQHLGGNRCRVERRHDQHVGRVGEAAKGILLHRLAVERH